jgi:putative transposase
MAKYEYILTEKLGASAHLAIQLMCRWLVVSTSGFYDWKTRAVSSTYERRAGLTVLVKEFFDASVQRYGYRRIHADLAAAGVPCSTELVRRIMRDEGLVPCQPRPFRVTTQSDPDSPDHIADLVQRDFTATEVGQKYVGDITYVHTWQGFVYLATVIDCRSKKVAGWAIADHMRAELVEDALKMVAATQEILPGAVFHSDRGSVYTSASFRAVVERLGMRSSMGRTGVCWDNAAAESFFAALKNELVYRTVYPTKKHAERDIGAYIEGFYNSKRRHSGLNYQIPDDVHYGEFQLLLAA